MAQRWYYQMLMEDFGPVTAEQVSALIEEGTLSETDLIRAEDSDQWFEVSQWSPGMVVTSTEPLDSGSDEGGDPEQITDLSELSFEFEDSPSSDRPRRESILQEIPEPAKKPVVFTASETRQKELSNAAEADQSIYYYQSLGQTMGPLPLSSLISLAESGALAADDSVCLGNSGKWKAANTFSELSSAFLTADRSVDSAPQLSLATQKRLGAAASAAALAPESQPSSASFELDESVKAPASGSRPSAEQSSATADDEPAKGSEASRTQKSSGKGKPSRKGSAKRREDALLEDIFEDVFSEEDAPPARPAAAMYSAPAQPISNAAMSSSSSMASTPQYSPAAPSPPAYRPTPAPMPMPSRSSSGGSSDAIMMVVKIAAVLVLIAGVGAGAYYGLSGMAAPPIGDYSSKLKAVAEELKKFDNKPTEAQWAEFSKKQAEFAGYQNTLLQANASGPEVDKCKMAITMFLRVASTRFKDPERIKKTTLDFLEAVKRLP